MRRALMFALVFFAAPRLLSQNPDAFFDGRQLQEIRIRMAPADWVTIHEKYLENGYYRCDFEWKGVQVANIGMRSRGSQSRSPVKPSIGLDFSRYLSTQRFLGLKTLVMRNLNQDASMMRERLAEMLFQRVGLPYSREAHARLYVNDEYVGVYLLVEPIDERFMKTRVGEDTGFLYEVGDVSPAFKFDFRGMMPESYVPLPFEPKTRTKELEASMGIVEMVRVVNEAPESRFIEEAGKVVDLPGFLAHAAAEQVLAQWDGLLGGSGMNNIYLYRRAGENRALPLVWDQDGAFTDVNWSVWNETEENVLFRRALRNADLKRRYVDALWQSATAMGGEGGWMEQEVERIYEQIRAAVYEDPVRLCRVADAPGGIGDCTIERFENDVASLRAFARRRQAVVLEQLAGQVPALSMKPNGVVNLVSGEALLVPGGLGRVVVKLPLTMEVHASGRPLPKVLAGVSLETDAGLADLVSAGPEGIVFVVPDGLRMGPEALRVKMGAEASNWWMVMVEPTGGGVAGVMHADGRIVSTAAPAQRGEALAAYGTGLWPVGLAKPAESITVMVGGKPARVLWAGAAPGWIGLEQVNFVVPFEADSSGMVEIVYEGEMGGWLRMAIQ